MGAHPPNAPYTQIPPKERQAKALELRKAGMTYQQIADALGYGSHSAAQKAIQSGLKAIIREPAEDLRTLELERLDKMLASHWPAVLKGHVRSTEVAIRIMERRAALIGLDAPKNDRLNIAGELGIRRYIGVDPEAV